MCAVRMASMAIRNAATMAARSGLDRYLVHQMAMVKSLLEKEPVDLKNLCQQCVHLSKVLDFLVLNNVKSNHRHDLLSLVQQVCKFKDKPEARPALMVLLLSIKSAFRTDWLSTLEVTGSDEIFATLNSLFDSFTSSHEDSAEGPLQSLQCGGSAVKDPLDSINYLTSISERFYPSLQLIAVFVAVQAKVGYEVLMCDFHVPHMHIQDRVRLYVSKTDSLETATCLITPPQVIILVNGRQVERRVATGCLEAGPQMPSDVTALVKVGANVLQVIGEFSASYVIAAASSRTINRSANNTHLEDYVAPTKAASSEVDTTEVDEVVEEASRLPLWCPISHQRLVTPVKARTCEHLQCFDYDSFLKINEKRPAWRCPCCNCFTSWSDLRIDRQTEKVLKETDEKILEVLVSHDGSWVPISTSPNVTPVEFCEVGNDVIDLSATADEEVNVISQNSNEIQLPDREPDNQTLQAINKSRDNSSQGTNPAVRQDSVEQPRSICVSDITTTAPQTSQDFAEPSRALNVNGGVLYRPIPETSEMPVQSIPAPSTQAPPAANHNSQENFSQSRTDSHLSSSAGHVNGYRTSLQLQQPQIGTPSNTGFVTRSETEWIWQRQGGQRSPGSLQNNQHNRTQQQWRGPGTNTAQTQNSQPLQQFFDVDSSRAWRGPRGASQWPPSSGNVMQVPGAATALEQNWRQGTTHIRGSVTNPSEAHGALGLSRQVLQQWCRFDTVPQHSDFVPHGFNRTPEITGHFQMRMPTPGHLQTMPPFPRGPHGEIND